MSPGASSRLAAGHNVQPTEGTCQYYRRLFFLVSGPLWQSVYQKLYVCETVRLSSHRFCGRPPSGVLSAQGGIRIRKELSKVNSPASSRIETTCILFNPSVVGVFRRRWLVVDLQVEAISKEFLTGFSIDMAPGILQDLSPETLVKKHYSDALEDQKIIQKAAPVNGLK